MDNLATDLTKAITAVIEQNEKRSISQKATQEEQGKLLEELLKRIESLEMKCQRLVGDNAALKVDNAELKTQLEQSRKLAEEFVNDTLQTRSTIENLKGELDTMKSKFDSLSQFCTTLDKELKKIDSKQFDITQQFRCQNYQQQISTASALKAPVKSTSTLTFQTRHGSDTYHSLPLAANFRTESPVFQKNNLFCQSTEPDEVIAHRLETLMGEIVTLNELNHSFHNSSINSNS